MSCSVDADVWACHEMVADTDFADVQDRKVIVSEEVRADLDVVAVIAEKR